MHQLRISLHQRRFISIILSQVPVAVVANDGVAYAEALRSQIYKAVFSEINTVTHTRLCTVKFLPNRMASPIFPLKKNPKSVLSPFMSYNKQFARASF